MVFLPVTHFFASLYQPAPLCSMAFFVEKQGTREIRESQEQRPVAKNDDRHDARRFGTFVVHTGFGANSGTSPAKRTILFSEREREAERVNRARCEAQQK